MVIPKIYYVHVRGADVSHIGAVCASDERLTEKREKRETRSIATFDESVVARVSIVFKSMQSRLQGVSCFNKLHNEIDQFDIFRNFDMQLYRSFRSIVIVPVDNRMAQEL